MPNESRDDQIYALVVFNRLFYAAVLLAVILIGSLVYWVVSSL
jgi:hypothetical protein